MALAWTLRQPMVSEITLSDDVLAHIDEILDDVVEYER